MTRLAGGLALSSRILGANDRIRIGMIGPGFRGVQLIGAMKEPNAEFVAFADAYTGRLDIAKKLAPGAKTYLDYRYLLDDKNVDAVVISTPQHLHAEHFVAALGAGKHVYQEKTMAFTVEHAKRMRTARLNAPKLTVQIGHQDCSSGQVADAAGFLKQGLLGKITEIHAHMYRNTPHNKPQWSRPIPPGLTQENVIWKSFLGEAPERPFDANRYVNWRFFWDYSGGNFYENMCHQMAFWYKVLGLNIATKVCTNGGVFLWKDGREVPDTMVTGMVHSSEELMFTWDSGFGNDELNTTEDVLGTDGTISRGEAIRYKPQKVNRPEGKPIEGKTVDNGQSHLDTAHLKNFLDCIRSGQEPNCPFEIGFRVAIACRMAVDSYRFGKVLHWDPAKEEVLA
ncbi:MAG TPA: Gfo/Idh/MocA family oxidoreductase [Bryobacteraceae bacterium]